MAIVIVLLSCIVILGILAAAWSRLSSRSDSRSDVIITRPTCSTCSGEDTRCEHECLLEAAVHDIEYYDDEELDRFSGRPADCYSDEEVKEFRDVLYTMQPSEVKGWNRSLILRGINVPDQIKDELFLLIENQ